MGIWMDGSGREEKRRPLNEKEGRRRREGSDLAKWHGRMSVTFD